MMNEPEILVADEPTGAERQREGKTARWLMEMEWYPLRCVSIASNQSMAILFGASIQSKARSKCDAVLFTDGILNVLFGRYNSSRLAKCGGHF